MSEPLPISPSTLRAGAGELPHHQLPANAQSEPYKAILTALTTVGPVDLLGLAERHLGKPLLTHEGKPREQSQPELLVLVVEQFSRWLNEQGMGACVLNGSPHFFGGSHWKPITDQECGHLLGLFAEQLGVNLVNARYFLFREKLVKQFFTNHVESRAEKEPGLVRINFRNGTLEIVGERHERREFRKSDMLTYQLPFDYDEQAECPTFDRYLNRVLPDSSSRDVLAEFLGWVFVRDLKLEKVLVLYGDGHNGKSVFFDVVNALLGEHNITNYGLSSLSKLENRHLLGSALLNFGSEISERCDADLFKKLASGEPVEARRLYKDSFIMKDYARLAFNANLLPKDTEHTTGFFRRFLIVPFQETITEEEKDPDLARTIIRSELSGVFNWVMSGLKRLRTTREFSRCNAADKALAAYKKESDSTASFLEDENLVASPSGEFWKSELYALYQNYCHNSGYRPLSINKFGKRLSSTHRIKDGRGTGGSRFWCLSRQGSREKRVIPSVSRVTCVFFAPSDTGDARDTDATNFSHGSRMSTDSPTLDLSLLKRVRHVGEKITAQCPACAEDGRDRKGNHLVIFPNGKFACAGTQGDSKHRSRIFDLIGIAGKRARDPEEVRAWMQQEAMAQRKARDERQLIADARSRRDAIIARHEWEPADVWEDSPQRIDSDLVEIDPRHFLAALFPKDALLWTGQVFESGEGYEARWRTRGELTAEHDVKLIGPMVTPSTWIQGRSSRTRANVLTTPYVVLDFDGIDGVRPETEAEREELVLDSLALIRWFREGLRWQLAAILHTGSKSLHAWFHKPPQDTLGSLKTVASALGLDAGLIGSPEHPCRLPGQRHEKTGNFSSVLWLQAPKP